MQLVKRRIGSQRASAAVELTIEPNCAGQGGWAEVCFRTSDGQFLRVIPENLQETRELLSAVHIAHNNFNSAVERAAKLEKLKARSS